jgi:hypothetical protein|tara:strand:+ start:178 stop:489 length:312 start_codon:yes stop_codon:yes gene_type:complete
MKIHFITTMQYIVWIILSPLAPLIWAETGYYNCWYYCVYRKILFGGKIHWLKSKRYNGYHWVYESENGEKWEYTLKKMPRFTPWYFLLFYRGVERKYRGKLLG